jgi:hypothetical protein
VKRPYLHVYGGIDRQSVFLAERDLEEVRDHFARYVGDVPVALPASFERLEVLRGDGDNIEAWLWGLGPDGHAGLDLLDFIGGKGWSVVVDGREAFTSWEDEEDE